MQGLDHSLSESPQIVVDPIRFPKSKQIMGETNKPHLGMFLWGVEIETGKAEKIIYNLTSIPLSDRESLRHEVIFSEKVFYCWAINKKNALKKFQNRKLG